jgi:hypothetical protein
MSNDRSSFGLGNVYNNIQNDPDMIQAEKEMREAGFNDCYLSHATIGDQEAKLVLGKEITCYQLPWLFSFFTKANHQTADYLKLTKTTVPFLGDIGLGEARKNGTTYTYPVDLNKKKM